MKNTYLMLILFISIKVISQTEVLKDEIVFENKIAFLKSTHNEFTGIINSSISKYNHPVFQNSYENGQLVKYTEYYNIKEPIICKEIFYNIKTTTKSKELQYSSDKKKVWNTEYNSDGVNTLYEIYENQELIYSCHYSNGKKNGIEICKNKEGTQIKKKYLNGKLIQ